MDPEEYVLTVEGEGLTTTTFSLEDLKNKFPKVAAVCCVYYCVYCAPL